MVAYGDVETAAKRVRVQFDAGADYVCVNVTTTHEAPTLAMAEFREFAPAMHVI